VRIPAIWNMQPGPPTRVSILGAISPDPKDVIAHNAYDVYLMVMVEESIMFPAGMIFRVPNFAVTVDPKWRSDHE
jgi:hypothetical protein